MGHNLHLKKINNYKDAKRELLKIGVDDVSIPMMAPKMRYWVLKLIDVDVRAANIIKQEMLSKGGEAAVAKWSAGFTRPTTDVLLMGSLKHFKLIIKKLKIQPYGLKGIAKEIEEVLVSIDQETRTIWDLNGKKLTIGGRTLVMAILNVTPDSFSDSGKFNDIDIATDHALKMVGDGADIIDIGGESTRPDSKPVSVDEELSRVIPIILNIRKKSEIPISIDTQKSKVAKEALSSGADIINDVSAMTTDDKMIDIVSESKAPIIIMHMKNDPSTMQNNPTYEDLIPEILGYLNNKMEIAIEAGIEKEKIAIDPGFGFGKTVEHNLTLLRKLEEFKSLGRPIVIGTSRKSTIGKVLDRQVDERVEGTAATIALSIAAGASIIRVHDVAQMFRVAKMADAVVKGVYDG